MNNEKFIKLRNKYETFIYNKYQIEEQKEDIVITYYFEIKGLTTFKPTITIPKKYITNKNINEKFFNYLVFNLGMVELLSYYKCVCCKKVIIKAGYLNEEQIKWFKKLYYLGLGEFLYTNGINVSQDELMKIIVDNDLEKIDLISYEGNGNLIPIGGGKDSVVTLELLKGMDNTCIVMNPKQANLDCIKVSLEKEIFYYRTIDKKLLELNKEGYLNGHTPFSAHVAFSTYIMAYLTNKKYIVLSNEASANESTVLGTNINHQYSKTYEFENDFNLYTKKYFKIDIKYFSLLRALNEFQIGMIFSNLKKYHKVFKSCNVGSKNKDWLWCNNCPKCLFVYIILSPFLYKKELIDIFHEDLFEKESLLETFKELLGYSKTKPFECVGTYTEVRYAVSLTIKKLGDNLPYLLKYYKENYELELHHNKEKEYNKENNLDPIFVDIIKKELDKYV